MSEQGSTPHPILSKIPDALCYARMAAGVGQAIDTLVTPPEDRTWKEGFVAGAVAYTDNADGKLSRKFGSSAIGAALDRAADVVYSLSGESALAVNGEISPIHPILTTGRELLVNGLRKAAVANGQPAIKVGSLGRKKTTSKLVMLTAARSPLATKPNLIESMASVGTAFSLLSGAEYVQKYFAGRKATDEPKPAETNTSRNGKARRATASPMQQAAQFIHDKAPSVTPSHLTRIGETMVEASGLVALVKPEWGAALAIGPYTAGGLVDGVDGNLARIKEIDDLKGMIDDVEADKRQEIWTAAVNSLIAMRKNNPVAARQYAVAAMTSTLPALFRAAAEARGHIVSEDATGSRVVRGIEGGVGMGLNSHAGTSNVVSALMMTGNVMTAAQRAEVVVRGSKSPHYRGSNYDPEFRSQAAARRDALVRMSVGGFAVGAGLLLTEKAVSKAAPLTR